MLRKPRVRQIRVIYQSVDGEYQYLLKVMHMIYAVLIGDVGRRQEVMDFLKKTKHYALVEESVTDEESVVVGIKTTKGDLDSTYVLFKETLKGDIDKYKLIKPEE